ncbi:MAG: MFS transporter [Rhizobiales bacterium]|nr:MFS transporter [Hyphomicrobiales bacterium]NRB12815.1 MFS transporter [Hyphomicrobiales bacterium]
MTDSTRDTTINDSLARKNAILLGLCFALGGVTTFSVMSLAANVAFSIATDKSLATLPITSFLVASMLTSVPASMLMQKIGRKSGFRIGIIIGTLGCLLAAFAIYLSSFWVLVASTFLIGIMASFQAFYRFAAADTASDKFKSVAVSWVMFGGVLAPIFAPTIISYSKNLLDPYFIAGTFVAAAAITLVSLIVISYINIPNEKITASKNTGRPLIQIIKQPLFAISVGAAMASYGLMTFVMTATPLAILGCGQGYEIDDVTFVIQWHAIAMYGPAFFTGKIIQRIGAQTVIILGLAMLAGCALVAAMGVEITHFWVALVLLGLGWNFGFVGATAMITRHYRSEEKYKAQAFNDFMVFGTLAVGSFASGKIYNAYGWNGVTWIVYPVVAFAMLLIVASLYFKSKEA